MRALTFVLRRHAANLTMADMGASVKNASNLKQKRIDPETQHPFRPLYLDGAATTPLDPRVLDKMLPYFTSYYGNPHSVSHAYGWQAEAAVENARMQIAELINADPREIIFTSGATESNNIAIKGAARFYKSKKKHIIASQIEHKCVLDSCRYLKDKEGFDVTFIKPEVNGLVNLEELAAEIRPDTSIVSIMAVNNEIGVAQNLHEIGALCKKNGVLFHTDAAQAVGKIPLDVKEMNVAMMSISGHKIYGPKGIGALYVRRKPRVRLEPMMSGGGQERGYRSGTLPHNLVVGLGEACRIAGEEMEADHLRICQLVERFKSKISSLEHVTYNGDKEGGIPNILNLSFAAVEGESLLMSLSGIALSSGSACTSATLEPSYVLRAIGADVDLAHSSIRFGFGRFTTEEEVDYTAEQLVHHVNRLRDLSPLWDMLQEGIDLKSIQWGSHH